MAENRVASATPPASNHDQSSDGIELNDAVQRVSEPGWKLARGVLRTLFTSHIWSEAEVAHARIQHHLGGQPRSEGPFLRAHDPAPLDL